MEQLIIRNYEVQDLEACRTLWRQLTEWHREIYQDQTIGGDHPEAYFDQHLSAVGPDHIWVAVLEGRVVGIAGLVIRGEEAEVEPIIVALGFRGKGFGRSMLAKVVAEAQMEGARLLTVKPVARNTPTIRFLHKNGFTNIGHVELFMDFSKRPWKPGCQLFGCEFRT